MQDHHRSGPLKQSNKAHKTGKHRSKGAVDAINRGRVDAKAVRTKDGARSVERRADRKFQLAQRRKKKKDEAAASKRRLGGIDKETRVVYPPVLCAVVSLTDYLDNKDVSGILDKIKGCSDEVVATSGNLLHLSFPRFKTRYAFVCPDSNDEHEVLDACKVSDAVVLVVSAQEDGLAKHKEALLTAILAQGLPADPVFVVGDVDELPAKRRQGAKKEVAKSLSKRFGGGIGDKVVTYQGDQDGVLLLRMLGSQRMKRNALRDKRAHLIAEDVELDQDGQTLRVTGYVRGKALSANRLVHIPGVGSFQLDRVESGGEDPHPLSAKNKKRGDVEMSDDEKKVLAVPDAERQEGLESENDPGMFDGEQYLSPEDEANAAMEDDVMSEEQLKEKRVLKVPKGTSDYQAAWIFDAEEVDQEDDDDDEEDEDDENMIDAESQDGSDDEDDDGEQEELETMTLASEANDENYDEKHVDFAEESESLRKLREERTDAMFPDEVDTPAEIAARVRFQKYRGLGSFRTSPWDPKENLPSDYARIFQFENFNRYRLIAKHVQKVDVNFILNNRFKIF